METTWKLQDAKAKFSQVVENAMKKGPQVVTRRGQKAVIVLSIEAYEKMVSHRPSFKNFLLSCPKISQDFEFDRPKDLPRSIEF